MENRSLRPPRAGYWLFSAPVDLCVFLGSALFALMMLEVGRWAGVLHQDTPEWTWVPFVLLLDVAHVYATAFRVYFDGGEFKRRPWLYTSVPMVGFVLGVLLYSAGELVFWRVLAYLAVFHFIRQQYGWVALYRAKRGERNRWGKRLDSAAIYLATIYPLIYWHAELSSISFQWFLEDDFLSIPQIMKPIARLVEPVYWIVLAAYAVKSFCLAAVGHFNPGKDIVVATTAVCWHVGIITFNSDYAFTVTNVVIHGAPYIALVYFYMRRRKAIDGSSKDSLSEKNSWSALRVLAVLLGTIWLLAYIEELVWDRAIWMERDWLFGQAWTLDAWRGVLTPLLATPQLTHYILDGFIWKRKNNPRFTL